MKKFFVLATLALFVAAGAFAQRGPGRGRGHDAMARMEQVRPGQSHGERYHLHIEGAIFNHNRFDMRVVDERDNNVGMARMDTRRGSHDGQVNFDGNVRLHPGHYFLILDQLDRVRPERGCEIPTYNRWHAWKIGFEVGGDRNPPPPPRAQPAPAPAPHKVEKKKEKKSEGIDIHIDKNGVHW
jgi:hypothetical protein